MKLRNKKTGDIRELPDGFFCGDNLKKICEEWEDYEEPKSWWYIDIHGPHKVTNNDEYYQQVKAASKEIGNCFETREEAELAVHKLKAWKRLKDKGFEFTGFSNESIGYEIKELSGDFALDLDLLFNGGEE